MDSRIVTHELRKHIRPLLEANGFSTFTGRKAWRYLNQVIQVVDFRSLTTYLASVIGTTSFSFCVGLGIYYHAISKVPWGDKDLPSQPQESSCHARRILLKTVTQPELPRPDIWYVRPDGENLRIVVDDVRKALVDQALPWLSEFSKLETAMTAFESRHEIFIDEGIAVEIIGGNLGSLARARSISALAYALGQRQHAIEAWQVILRNPFYDRLEETRREAEESIQWLLKIDRDQ